MKGRDGHAIVQHRLGRYYSDDVEVAAHQTPTLVRYPSFIETVNCETQRPLTVHPFGELIGRDGSPPPDRFGGRSALTPSDRTLKSPSFGKRASILDGDTEASDRALDLGVAKQDLHGAQIADAIEDQRCLRATKKSSPVVLAP